MRSQGEGDSGGAAIAAPGDSRGNAIDVGDDGVRRVGRDAAHDHSRYADQGGTSLARPGPFEVRSLISRDDRNPDLVIRRMAMSGISRVKVNVS